MVNADNSSQPAQQQPAQAIATETPVEVLPHDHEELEQQQRLHQRQLYFVKSIAVLLALQGLWSLFNSIKFIFFELPLLEQQLSLGQIDNFQINIFANKAIVMTISTILSLFFALRITIVQSKAAKRISTAIAILLVLGNTQINSFLNGIGSSTLITTAIVETLRSILSF
jgi:hypothetical protein